MVPTQKSSKKFHCENCDYFTSRKSQYERHLLTDKHKILQNPTKSYKILHQKSSRGKHTHVIVEKNINILQPYMLTKKLAIIQIKMM